MTDALDPRTTELVGVAAAIAGHCQPCFDFHYRKALEIGVTPDEIRAAVALARAVRAAGDRHLDEHANRRMTPPAQLVTPAAAGAAPGDPGPGRTGGGR